MEGSTLKLKDKEVNYQYKQLLPSDVPLLEGLLRVFGEAFEDVSTYQKAVPSHDYLEALLAKPHFIALVVMSDTEVAGGLTAYELDKYEQERKEIYIYDLAVSEPHRRKGLATELIEKIKNIAHERGAYSIYVQADREDLPAIALYESLGTKEAVYHFDIQ